MFLSKFFTNHFYLNILILISLVIIAIQFLYLFIYIIVFIKKYFYTKEADLHKLYGYNTWVLITGCSSGQGKKISTQFARRNFNIILVGSKRIYEVETMLKQKYNIKTICIVKDFCNAHKKNFFNKITKTLNELDGELSILVNNVGHRVAWKPYHTMPSQKINDTIICGTIVQSRLTQIVIKHFLNRKMDNKSCIINITAMCIHKNFWFGQTGEFSIPYLSVYESANAFGYFHSNSIQKEYGELIDILNITPGAVLTENTQYLKDIPFIVDQHDFINTMFTLIGNYNGPQYGHWKHELISIFANFMFFYKDKILESTGNIISQNYMNQYNRTM
jgi:short-subunit dehydrogenase